MLLLDHYSPLRSEVVVNTTQCTPVYILLSLYNGAAFLQEQLESLEQQTCSHWVLLWRDDGSTDASAALMAAFTQKHGAYKCQQLALGHGQRMGVFASYWALLAATPNNAFVAFCDQDDFWFPDKLERGLAALQAAPSDRPALYCARQVLTDETLHPIALSPDLPEQTSLLQAMTQNIATGCSVMLSPAACQLIQKAPYPFAHILHDWWAYLVVCAAEGTIITDNEPALLYRQHQHNTVGACGTFCQRALAALKRGPHIFMTIFWENTKALRALPNLLTSDNRKRVSLLTRGRCSGVKGLTARFSLLRQLKQLRRHNMWEQAVFRLWFLLG